MVFTIPDRLLTKTSTEYTPLVGLTCGVNKESPLIITVGNASKFVGLPPTLI
jgi:hypothetical protein